MNETHPPPPVPEVLHRVRDDLHPIAERHIHVDRLVLIRHCREEEHESPVRLEQVAREPHEVTHEVGEFVGFRWWHIVRLPRNDGKMKNYVLSHYVEAE